ncbi:chitin binding domain protein, partial [Vibrio parahaemolyticus V-223/04]
VLLEC